QRLASRYLDDGALKKPEWQLGDGRLDLYESLRTHTTATIPPPPPPDTTAPTVTLTTPSSGATVTGVVTVTASASDDIGVAGVQFLVDGGPVGAEATSAPYAFTWNSTTVSNGSHVLAAIARDAAGNQRTAGVSVNVANDTTRPTVTLTSPSEGATITETITLDASASDDVGVVGVQFTLDGVPVGAERTEAPYTLEWNSAT